MEAAMLKLLVRRMMVLKVPRRTSSSLRGMMKIDWVFIAVSRIEDEHPSKEEKLGQDEKPHAQSCAGMHPWSLQKRMLSPHPFLENSLKS